MFTCVLVVIGAAVAGCSGGLPMPTAGPHASGPASPSASATATSPASAAGRASSPSPSSDPRQPTVASAGAACVAQVYGRMTQAQRVGQLFLVGVYHDVAGPATAAALAQYHFGSLLLGTATAAGVSSVSAATAHMQSLATGASTSGVRLFIAANQEGGQIQPLTGP